MRALKEKSNKKSLIIDEVDITTETLALRGGLSLFVHYIGNIGLEPHLERLFASIRKSAKDQAIAEIFSGCQVLLSNLLRNKLVYGNKPVNVYTAALNIDFYRNL
jgi:hypothetical protein